MAATSCVLTDEGVVEPGVTVRGFVTARTEARGLWACGMETGTGTGSLATDGEAGAGGSEATGAGAAATALGAITEADIAAAEMP